MSKVRSHVKKRSGIEISPINLVSSDATMTVVEAGTFVGIGRTKLYEEIKCGRLKIRKCGNRTLITKTELLKWLDELPSRPAPSSPVEDLLVTVGLSLLDRPLFARFKDGVVLDPQGGSLGLSVESGDGDLDFYLIQEWLGNLTELSSKQLREQFTSAALRYGLIEGIDLGTAFDQSNHTSLLRLHLFKVHKHVWAAWARARQETRRP